MHEARFASIAEQLLRAGVAPRHVRRTVFELEGHFADLLDELRMRGVTGRDAEAEASARLNAEAVVAAVLARPELQSWMRRRPMVAFAIFPLVAYAVVFVGGVALLVACVALAEKGLGIPLATSTGLQYLVTAFLTAIAYILPASVAAWFCAVARTRRAPLLWPIIGVALIALLGATTNAQLQLPPLVDKPALGAGIGFSTHALSLPLFRAAATCLVVLVPYLWLARPRLSTE
jgi:hypothetical protein